MQNQCIDGIQVVGVDPSLRHWGISKGIYNVKTQNLHIYDVATIEPVLSTGKQVRQNSLDLESAKQLCEAMLKATQGAKAIFVEIPIGSQSARAMAGYGICVGVLGALRATGIPFFEITPTEVKVASVGYKNATKAEMIQWATTAHPEANWPTYKQHGKDVISAALAEHQADSIGAIYAGLASNQFKQIAPFIS